MKKYLIIISIAIVSFTSCEKDSICIDPITPNLIIKFYDYEDPAIVKPVTSLTVWAKGKDSIYYQETLDSIVLPLDVNIDTTYYNFSSNKIVDQIDFAYSRNNIFVGRSCGYKTIFENFEAADYTTNWIKNIEIKNTIIENDSSTSVLIYH